MEPWETPRVSAPSPAQRVSQDMVHAALPPALQPPEQLVLVETGEHQSLLVPIVLWFNTLSMVSPKEQHLPRAWKKCRLPTRMDLEKQGGSGL